MMIKHISKSSGKNAFTAPLYRFETGSKKKIDLLWGDRVEVVDDSGSRAKVRVRGMSGFVSKSRLVTKS